MKLRGNDIEIVRGENASINFILTDEKGIPFRLLLEDQFSYLTARFVVKKEAFSRKGIDYVIDKTLVLDNLKRFSEVDPINLEEYDVTVVGIYDPYLWVDEVSPLEDDINKLFYHPQLNEYRYYDGEKWVIYDVVIIVPFDIDDTYELDYREYYYDLAIEAGDEEGTISYRKILIPQARFVVSYKV